MVGEFVDREVEAAVGHDPIPEDGIVVAVVERHELVVGLEVGELESRDPLAHLDRQFERPGQLGPERPERLTRRWPVEAAQANVDRMDRAAADQFEQFVADLLQFQPALHRRAVERDQIDDAVDAEEVGGVEHVDVERVALDPLAAVEQPPQFGDVAGDLDPTCLLDRPARRHLVRDRADAADARRDVGRFGVAPSPEEPLVEARWLVDPQLDVDQAAVDDLDVHRTLALDAGQRVGAQPAGTCPMGHDALPISTRTGVGWSRNGSDHALNVWNRRPISSSLVPRARSVAISGSGRAESIGPKHP